MGRGRSLACWRSITVSSWPKLNLWKPTLEQRTRMLKPIKGYMDAGNQLEAFLTAQGMPPQAEHIRREHIEACLIKVTERTSVSTQARATASYSNS